MQRRSFIFSSFAVALAAPSLRAAETFPSRPVRIISPYAAGGGPDVQLRQAGPPLGEVLGQSIVIENKVGAAGALAAQYVAQQPADGYTLLLGSNTHLVQKILQPSLKFDPIADFTPICNLASSPTVLVVNAEGPYKRFEDLLADGKARPGQLNYGSGGVGTAAHLAGATLDSLAHLKATHVPLKGSVEIASSLIRGDTQFACPIAGTGVPQVKGGKLRALAVTSGQRLKELPNVPTLNELLKNDLTVQESWFGIWAPARTPPAVIKQLHAALLKVTALPAIRSAYEAVGNEVVPSESPEAFAAFVKSENRKWADIVKLTGVTAG